jgi:hypothetical protein
MFTFSIHRKSLALVAVVAACCAILAPAASAMIPDRHFGVVETPVRPDDRATHGIGAQLQPGDLGYATHDVGATASDAGIVVETPVRPDDRATHGIGAQLQPGDLGYATHDVGATLSDIVAIEDSLVSRPAPANSLVANEGAPVAAAPAASDSGFDWGDAGVGIALGILSAMLLGGLLMITRRRDTLTGA